MKNIFKKPVSLLLVLVLASGLCMPSFSATADTATISANDVSVNAGEYVDIPVHIYDNPGIMGFSINVKYDDSLLTPISVSSGTILSNGTMENSIATSESNEFLVVWYSSSNMQNAEGILFTIRFKAKDSAVGKTEINLSFNQGDTFNEDWQDVVFNCNRVIVDIKNDELGTCSWIYSDSISATAGEEFCITLYAENIGSLESFTCEIPYDESKFSYTSVCNFNGNAAVTYEGGCLRITWENTASSTTDGAIFRLDFKAVEYVSYDDVLLPILISSSGNVSFSKIPIKITNQKNDEPSEIYSEDIGVCRGEIIKIPISIKNNHGLMGFMIKVKYDSNIFIFQSLKKGDVISGGMFDYNIDYENNCIDVVWSGTENSNANGDLFFITFIVQNSAQLGDSIIHLDYEEANTFDESWNDVVLFCNSITIKVNNSIDNLLKVVVGSGAVIDNENGIIRGVALNVTENLDDYIYATGGAEIITASPIEGRMGTGTTIELVNNGSVIKTYTLIITGDLNGDALVDVTDLIYLDLAEQYEITLSDAAYKASDLIADGICDINDKFALDSYLIFAGEIDQTEGKFQYR